MKSRFVHLAASVSVLALMAWLFASQPDEPQTEGPRPATDGVADRGSRASDSSVAPCAAPLEWQIDRLDEEFGISRERAEAAVSSAARASEDGAGRPLFRHDPEHGMPVRFVYSERQARTEERLQQEETSKKERGRLEDRVWVLDSLRTRYSRLWAGYRKRVQEFERTVSAHNMRVRSWNLSGGSPESVKHQLVAVSDSHEDERRKLADRKARIDDLRRLIQARSERLRKRIEEYERRGQMLQRHFPLTRVKSGLYRDAARREDGAETSLGREIVICRYSDLADLERVLAHELGHALELAHTAVQDAVMNSEYGSTNESRQRSGSGPAELRLHPTDIDLWEARCPEITTGREQP